MRTDVLSFVMSSENRKRIVKTLLEYPKRQWSCTAMEETTKLPHATVFRALNGLAHFGILKSLKINRKDMLYELAESPLTEELQRAINIEKIAARSIAEDFVSRIKSENIKAAVLYGSSVSGKLKPESDIDLLVIAGKSSKEKILDIAAQVSSGSNRTVSPIVMDIGQFNREKKSQFMQSVKENMEVLYGKSPF